MGLDRLLSREYFRAKKVQEDLIKASAAPIILRSTQFFELIGDVTEGLRKRRRHPPVLVQPIASDDLADALADIALGRPLNRTIEVAGPEIPPRRPRDGGSRLRRSASVVSDFHARYFGVELDDRSLLPDESARIASLRFEDWLRQTLQTAVSAPPQMAKKRIVIMDAQVTDNPVERRFEMALADDAIVAAYYRVDDGRVVLIHTEVPMEFAGQGAGDTPRDWRV